MQDFIKEVPEGADQDQCQSLLKDAREDLLYARADLLRQRSVHATGVPRS